MGELTKQQLKVRAQIEALEAYFMDNKDNPEVAIGDSDIFPLKHTFVEGLYVREMKMDKGSFAIGKLQKHEHLWMLLQGKLTVTTQSGSENYIGPCYVTAKPGEKKAVYAHEDSIFVNIYPNPDNTQDLEKIENTWIAKNYLEYEEFKQLKE
jgi:quercetin dioxygenase-like cupin family protein